MFIIFLLVSFKYYNIIIIKKTDYINLSCSVKPLIIIPADIPFVYSISCEIRSLTKINM